jgi:ssRNA-specific RNase YbeY (16S rRNA maturation enzyme)
MLHLLGYDDATAADRAAMIERQDQALAACLRPRGRQHP